MYACLGEWRKGLPEGHGKLTSKNGKKISEGIVHNIRLQKVEGQCGFYVIGQLVIVI